MKILRTVKQYNLLEEAEHPKTGETYRLGDNVVLKDDHITHGSGLDYIMTINTMFSVGKDPQVYISEKTHKDSEYRRPHWASRPMGSYLDEAKRKITQKEINKIRDAQRISRQYV